ncbi:MAG: deoxyguanosinetriphosphate triphosphohydrolase [Paludibacteraceae bacterium]|nr:deoxyguanosinetriphosphate triphosphohydrolase [Prevotellaceae bacterium]
MNWQKLISTKRFGLETYHDEKKQDRTEFQRDYDRLVFSSPFRRLQNKTQVFPLPGNIFVHNRLTHSMEVSCVGRSLGNNVSKQLIARHGQGISEHISEIGSIVSAGCLAHDMGNPPFGHSGETAISSYFSEGNGLLLKEKHHLNDSQWNDIIHFEGNANAFRLLTHQFKGRRKGGFVLTYSTIASIVKYPYQSDYIGEKKKFGFFQSEKEDFVKIANDLGMIELSEYKYARHPLVFLVEAADDICYEIMDIEDAHKLKLISTEDTKQLLLNFFSKEEQEKKTKRMEPVTDENEQIAYLRSTAIGVLVNECSRVFVENEDSILQGTHTESLINGMSDPIKKAYKECEEISYKKIYKSKDVVDIEIAGYNIIYTLIEKEINAVFNANKAYSKQLLARIPEQYETEGDNPYQKIMSVLDYISGMTDIYALDLYRKITGMSLPNL